jgi:hypothetical protein
MSESTLLKPLIAGGIAVALDQMYLKEKYIQRSLYFGAAVAVGEYGAEFVHPIIKHINIPSLSRDLYDSKTLMERIAEVGVSSGMVYILNKYVLKNDQYAFSGPEFLNRVGIIAVADFAATYATEYLYGKPLEYLVD